MAVDLEARAAKAWGVLVKAAGKRRAMTYRDLGEAIGVYHRQLSKPLGLLQRYCLDAKLPPLTILVHGAGGRHGTGFTAWDIENIDEGVEKVFAENWLAKSNPFPYALADETQETLAAKLLEAPEQSEEVYRRVADRGNGLLLCATHHSLFDSGWMSVSEEYVILHEEADGAYAPSDALLTKALHKKRLRLPTRPAHRPDPALLRLRAAPGQDADPDSDER
jgi:putative restriction endonuclease